MKKYIHKLLEKTGRNNQRSLNISRHILLSFLYKGGSIVINLLLVRLSLAYLDKINFGIWLTLSSFIAWFSFFDIGLGSGLRNKFTEARINKDSGLARAYVSSAYFTVGLVSLGLILLFFAGNFFINWNSVFNTDQIAPGDLKLLMLVVITFFGVQLVMKLILNVYLADQHHSIQGQVDFYSQVSSLAVVGVLSLFSKASLLTFGIWISAMPVLVLLIFNAVSFRHRYRDYRPSYTCWKWAHTKDIFGLGVKFFIIQIAGIILFTTDNIIITQLFGPAEVVPYNIAYKYFGITTMLFSIIVNPYWSSITEAYLKQDFAWIRNAMNGLMKMIVPFFFLIVIMVLVSKTVYYYWIGSSVNIPLFLSVMMGIYFMITIFIIPFTYFINGTGKVKVQLIQSIVVALVNIPVSVLFAKHLGVAGVILGTLTCLLPSCVLAPLQYYKLINRNAKGAWNK